MNGKLCNENMDKLMEAVLSLKTKEECYAFFEDLCTVSELKSMQQRYHVAIMLDNGAQYADIVELTGASTATISRVNRALSYGADGYKMVLERMKENK